MWTPRNLAGFLALAVLLGVAGCRRPQSQPAAVPVATATGEAARLDDMLVALHQDYPDTPYQDVAAVLAWQAAGQPWTAVDARPEVERAVSTLPHAVLLADVLAAPEAWKDKRLVVYCTVGYRSAEATDDLRAAGLTAWNLDGGITAWAHAAQPLVGPDGQPTKRIHTYSKKWNYLPPGYTPVW